jgi:hypothetical protein
MVAESQNFFWSLLRTGATNAWGDLGTNGLGWFAAILSPFVAVGLKLRAAPKGQKLGFVRSKWAAELRDALFIGIAIWALVFLVEIFWRIPNRIWRNAEDATLPSLRISVPAAPDLQYPEPPTEPHRISQVPINITASVVNPTSPAIIVDNKSARVAEDVLWELVLFRARDSAFISEPTQTIRFIKAHSTSAPYSMFSPGIPMYTADNIPMRQEDMHEGDSLTGTLTVDCATCQGVTYILHIDWGHDGWFSEHKGGDGKLALPKEMSSEGIQRYISGLDQLIPSEEKVPIVTKKFP